MDLEKQAPVRIDNGTYQDSHDILHPQWSPDSLWISYVKQLENRMGAVKLYSLETGQATQITDGMSDARQPCFDKSGKYLYFAASTDSGPSSFGLNMSSNDRPVTRSVYVVVLRKDLPSPLAPESDEEKIAAVKPEDKKDDKPVKKPEPVKTAVIDLENIGQRILPLPMPARHYRALEAGKEGVLFAFETPSQSAPSPIPPAGSCTNSISPNASRKSSWMESACSTSHSMAKRFCTARARAGRFRPPARLQSPARARSKWMISSCSSIPEPSGSRCTKRLGASSAISSTIPDFHGLDLKAAEERYAPYLDGIGSRGDLNYLFNEMLGEFTVGHLIGGRRQPEVNAGSGGGCSAPTTRSRTAAYRFARVYNGENWNPQTRAPLTQPGVNVVAGEYLLAVNGRELRGSDEVYSFFEGTAGKSVGLRVGPDPAGAGAREVTVVPLETEASLRTLAWIEDNRRKVDQMSGGRLAYIHLPDTAGPLAIPISIATTSPRSTSKAR